MKPVKTAILSFGMSGQVFHAPFLAVHPGFHFYAVWERTKNLAEQKYPGVKTFRSLDDLLNDKAIELVIVNTPNYTHYEYAKMVLLAGKHVIVEKPFTATVEEGESLIQLAREKGKLLSVYQNRRYDSDFKVMQKIVREGWLGDLVEAEFHFDRYKQEISPKAHKEIPGPGTGVLYDLGSHIIDQALQLFGLPEAVFADVRTIRPVSQVSDYFELLLYYPGLRVRLHSSYLVREQLPGYILHGSKGSFIKARTDVQETALQSGAVPGGADWGREPDHEKGLLHTEKDGKNIRELVPAERGDYGEYFEGIYQALRGQSTPPVTAEDGLAVVKIIALALKSSSEGRVVRMELPAKTALY